jgi:hypothetical protein
MEAMYATIVGGFSLIDIIQAVTSVCGCWNYDNDSRQLLIPRIDEPEQLSPEEYYSESNESC